MRRPDATAIAIAFGLIVLLLGYLLPAAFGQVKAVVDLRTTLVGMAVILAAFAGLVAIFSLVSVHWRKLRAKRNPDRYSVFTLLAFVITFVAGVAIYGFKSYIGDYSVEYQEIVVNAIQVPVESSLMALLAVTLTLAMFRIFQRRQGVLVIVFVLSILLFLLLNSGLTALLEPVLPNALMGPALWIAQILPMAGGRGILLGIALGSIMAGLRILFGVERPYSG